GRDRTDLLAGAHAIERCIKPDVAAWPPLRTQLGLPKDIGVELRGTQRILDEGAGQGKSLCPAGAQAQALMHLGSHAQLGAGMRDAIHARARVARGLAAKPLAIACESVPAHP